MSRVCFDIAFFYILRLQFIQNFVLVKKHIHIYINGPSCNQGLSRFPAAMKFKIGQVLQKHQNSNIYINRNVIFIEINPFFGIDQDLKPGPGGLKTNQILSMIQHL
jgi:hypothetical protein